MQNQEELQHSPATTDLQCPLLNAPNIIDLCNRINCWRLDVDACSSCRPPPATFQRGSTSSLARVRSSARARPYSWHQRRPQSLHVMDCRGPVGFTSESSDYPTRTQQEPTSVPEQPSARGPDCNSSRKSPRTPSFRGVPSGDGLDLPHPEQNPLITHHPETVKEEYNRILALFRRLNAERRKAEYRLVRYLSKEARQHLMDIGTTIQHVIAAAQYIVDYSNSHGWDIDFDTLLYDDLIPPVKMLPSRMRELVCSPSHASSSGWHMQPAA